MRLRRLAFRRLLHSLQDDDTAVNDWHGRIGLLLEQAFRDAHGGARGAAKPFSPGLSVLRHGNADGRHSNGKEQRDKCETMAGHDRFSSKGE
jgi:hypothetical protein